MSTRNVHLSLGNIGLFSLLGVLFIGLKLARIITWSWWWVTAPLWGPYTLLLLAVIVALVVALIGAYRDEKRVTRYSIRHD